MRMSRCGDMNRRAPGSFLSCSRSRAITTSDDSCPGPRLSVMNIAAALRCQPPVVPVTYSTAGSACTMAKKRCSRCSMAWYDVAWSARMKPEMRPVSCSGIKPLSMAV